MLSEDNTVALSLSDDEKESEPKAQVTSPFSSMEAPPLLDDFDEPEETAPSKLRLDPSISDVPAASSSSIASSAAIPSIVPTSIPSSTLSSFSSLGRSDTPPSALDNANITVNIGEFQKRGDGMNAFLVYKVVTQSENVPGYPDRTQEVWRRFSDFLGLRDKLVEKHQSRGVIVPPAPLKNVGLMANTKTSGDVENVNIEIRMRQLERFVRRIVQHNKMRTDCDVRDFLTFQGDLTKSANTAALSGAGVKRMFNKVGEVFNKMAFHMEEGDRWFEQAQSQVDELDESLKKVLNLALHLASTRKELANAQESMSRALSMLASCEESTSLARALSHLTETEESVSSLWAKQSDQDTVKFAEALAEYVGLLGALKDVFNERVRMWQKWQESQQTLHKKRETKSRLELSGKSDRANQLKNEIEETAKKMDQQEQEFMDLSKVIREEINRFETQRRHDMRQIFIDYLQSLVHTHKEMLKTWEKFAPEAANIIA